MTEPQKPGEGEPAPYTLPSWIDQAIARSKDEAAPDEPTGEDESSVAEDADTAEYPAATEPSSPPRSLPSRDEAATTEVVPYFISPTIGATDEKHVKYPTVPETPLMRAEKEAAAESGAPEPDNSEFVEVVPERRGSALPWVIAALFLAAAALVLAYLIWMRPVPA